MGPRTHTTVSHERVKSGKTRGGLGALFNRGSFHSADRILHPRRHAQQVCHSRDGREMCGLSKEVAVGELRAGGCW